MGIDRDQIETKVREVLARHGGLSVDASAVPADRDLFGGAGLTSFASVNVMVALEGEFDVEFPDEMLKREYFESVDAIVGSIQPLVTAA